MAKKDPGRCSVCDDVAIGLNFGVPTCMPCKAFFRRNAVRLGVQQFVCVHDGDCLISYKFRRSCNCCRLARCFRVGMNKSLILSDTEREARNKLVEINRLKRGKIPMQQCARWMQTSPLLVPTANSVRCLRSIDQVALANIFNAYEKTCIVARNALLPRVSDTKFTTLHEYVNELSCEFQGCVEYFKQIPEFFRITADDKVRLLKNHFGVLVNLNGPMMQCIPLDNVVIIWTNVFGVDLAQRLLKSSQLLQGYLCDPVLLKIVLIILVLSSSNGRNLDCIDIDQICDDPLAIFAAQNVYVDLLWRYILSRSTSERNAVQFFNKLMMCILFMKNLDMDIDRHVSSLRCEIQQMDPIVKNMWPTSSQVEDITLTEGIIL